MHLSVEPNSFNHMPLVSLERTTKIVQRNAGDERNQLIGQDARNIALDIIVLPIFAPAGNHIIALVERLEHLGNIRRVILTIAIQWDNNLAARMIEPGHHGGSLTKIPLKMDDSNALIFFCKLIESGIGR